MQITNRVKNPKKQRKKQFNSPAHIRHKLMSAPLSPELFASKGVKSLPIRKGDTIKVIRGDHIGFDGKVSRVDLTHFRVYIEGLNREKADGTNVLVSIHPSKVMIKNLNLGDKTRKAILERKKPIIGKTAKTNKKDSKKSDKNKKEKSRDSGLGSSSSKQTSFASKDKMDTTKSSIGMETLKGGEKESAENNEKNEINGGT